MRLFKCVTKILAPCCTCMCVFQTPYGEQYYILDLMFRGERKRRTKNVKASDWMIKRLNERKRAKNICLCVWVRALVTLFHVTALSAVYACYVWLWVCMRMWNFMRLSIAIWNRHWLVSSLNYEWTFTVCIQHCCVRRPTHYSLASYTEVILWCVRVCVVAIIVSFITLVFVCGVHYSIYSTAMT